MLVLGFLAAFASVGVGFGGLGVEPDSAFAPGTPASIVHVAPSTLADAADLPSPVAPTATEPGSSVASVSAAGNAGSLDNSIPPVPTATLAGTNSPEPTPTAEPEAPAPESTTVAAAPAATRVPPTPTPAPAWNLHPVNQLTADDVRAAAASAGWPAGLIEQVVEVAWCESSYRPNATNGSAYGVMQLVPSWFDYAGMDFARWSDPVTNLRVAYATYQYDISRGNQPWDQWVCKPSSRPATTTPTPASTATPAATPTATAQAASVLGGQ